MLDNVQNMIVVYNFVLTLSMIGEMIASPHAANLRCYASVLVDAPHQFCTGRSNVFSPGLPNL